MSTTYPSALVSLDDSLAHAREGLRKLEAAADVDLEEIIGQFRVAAESGRKLRALVASRLPKTSWENREQLDAILESNSEKLQRERRPWYLLFARQAREAGQ
jgi:hypothetical protein